MLPGDVDARHRVRGRNLAGSLYAHIDGTERLLREIVEHGIAEYIGDASRQLAGTDDSQARLRALIRAHLEVVARGPPTTKIVFHQWRYLTEENRAHVRRRWTPGWLNPDGADTVDVVARRLADTLGLGLCRR